MPNGKYTTEIHTSIDRVWNFVSDINNWAPLVPGYIEHKIINDKQSTWKFVSDIGIIKRTLHMKIDITMWQEPTKVTFNLTGLNENFSGKGYFEAGSITDSKTSITGFLDITAKGVLGPAINPVLKTVIPKTATELTSEIAIKIKEVEDLIY
ncbi:CoxG family protein [Oceanobacillus senegalensis]|uniref:CoxG family protein n=1 Tax=Oceanobacillus senegalensis TaxID=1936063 RepID=UPI000A306CBA|nr:SRPBCC family protein [Oceanobacillus senegalensis]